MQLRFIPVFRRFEVVTEATPPEMGVALHTGPTSEVGMSLEQALATGGQASTHATVQQPLVRLFSQLEGGRGFVPALAWSQAKPRGDSLLVPVSDVASFGHSIGLRDEVQSELDRHFDGIADLVAGIEGDKREVSLFMGTHVEAVAGGCILQDLPPVETGAP